MREDYEAASLKRSNGMTKADFFQTLRGTDCFSHVVIKQS